MPAETPRRNWLLIAAFLVMAVVVVAMAIDYYAAATRPAAGALGTAVRQIAVTPTP